MPGSTTVLYGGFSFGGGSSGSTGNLCQVQSTDEQTGVIVVTTVEC